MAELRVETASTEFLFQRLASPRHDGHCTLCWCKMNDRPAFIVCRECVSVLLTRIRKLEAKPEEFF